MNDEWQRYSRLELLRGLYRDLRNFQMHFMEDERDPVTLSRIQAAMTEIDMAIWRYEDYDRRDDDE